MSNNDRQEKGQEQKFCNCRNSKCMKLYCECFAARQECNRLCRCCDCKNQNNSEHTHHPKNTNGNIHKVMKTQSMKQTRGCSCRKSFCVKKYCQCYQEGVLCGQNCKCVDCQNNESMANRSVLTNLKKKGSMTNNSGSLYPIILSQSAEHLQHLITEENSLNIEDGEMEEEVAGLFLSAKEGNMLSVINGFINILKRVDNRVSKMDEQEDVKLQMEQ